MLVAGLTGGIATGKSTVSRMLQDAGAMLVDADRIAHQVVQKGKPAWEKIRGYFGDQVLQPDGELNRERLGRIIFTDPTRKEALNRIVHPQVYQQMEQEVADSAASNPRAIIIVDVPLLIETGMHQQFSEVILVYVPESIQLKRLLERDPLSETEARTRIQSQISIEAKKKFASIRIDNSRDLRYTSRQVLEAYQKLVRKETDHSGHLPRFFPGTKLTVS